MQAARTEWDRRNARAFFRRFFHEVPPVTLNPEQVLAAAERYRGLLAELPSTKRRWRPTLADALTAEVVQVLAAQILITDDRKDFLQLLRRSDVEILSVSAALGLAVT
mgnify:CR=1 FL=1